MENYILLIKATGNPIGSLPIEKQQEHIQKVGGFIQDLVSRGKLKDAQPLEANGVIISNKNGSFTEQLIAEKEEIIVGYYLLVANDLSEVIQIAKSDPRFSDGEWKMEIRPIKNIDGIN